MNPTCTSPWDEQAASKVDESSALARLLIIIFERLWRLREVSDNWRKVTVAPICKKKAKRVI